ncbi:hypothetical protein OUZ56_001754 [Daphnia magna]|uniref:Uncharacterized protein n=1 Tax=Daphnia magna TaxID=35525 RepID=A0ABR0A3M0_9CRUS|nr:hypothetical protein OUZ56_001754 [Daphnia magna]
MSRAGSSSTLADRSHHHVVLAPFSLSSFRFRERLNIGPFSSRTAIHQWPSLAAGYIEKTKQKIDQIGTGVLIEQFEAPVLKFFFLLFSKVMAPNCAELLSKRQAVDDDQPLTTSSSNKKQAKFSTTQSLREFILTFNVGRTN